MALPSVTQTIADGALGLSEANPTGTQVKIGASSAGTVNVLRFFTDPTALAAEYGTGPLVEAAAHVLATAGGPVGVVRATAATPGAFGAVTKSAGTGSGTATMTVAGAALDAYQVIIKITRGAANLAAGTATFQYSLDGGDTWSADIAMPVSGVYAIPGTGATVTFADGTFVVNDTFSTTGTAPGVTIADLGIALTALRADPAKWGFLHVVGAAADAAGTLTLATTVGTHLAAAEAGYRYAFGIIEAPDVADDLLTAGLVNFVNPRVGIAAGYCELASAVSGRIFRRSAAWPVTARISQQDIRRDVGRVRDDKEGGSLEGVTAIARDEYVTPKLDEARFITLRTFPGAPGFYVTNGRLMASANSDFKFIQYRRIMDLACTVNYLAMLEFLNDDAVRVQDVTGYINEVDARAIEAVVKAKLAAELTDKNRVSAVDVKIKRDANILSTQTLTVSVRVTPRGYAKFITVDIGFYNPALAPKAA